MSIDDIKNVLVVGAGTLGLRIALRCAFDGYQVKMYDISEDQLAVAGQMQSRLTADFLKKGMITTKMVEQAKSGLAVTTDIDEAVTNVDLVSESVIENIDIKKAFYADFAPRLKKGTILTTNTSYLLPSMMLESIAEPENFCALHFHDVFNQTVVDIMPHPLTAPAVTDLLMEFGRRIKQIPVYIKKESPGYIFNSMLMAIIGQAASLHLDDVGSIQDIDRSFMGNFNTPLGPFGILDQIGLDTAWHVVNALSDDQSVQFATVLKSYLDQGKLGYKSGEGFYSYPDPEYSQASFLRG
ncbi:MAG: 3-hydroxybutyryl-CoA dehydrogenase [Gammaproteobacteria bacterium]|nr:3-hydroxybutyryl-CoA dehydrogenase [Gammaproteobacteria bacterium]